MNNNLQYLAWVKCFLPQRQLHLDLKCMRLKILNKVGTASLNSEFTSPYKKSVYRLRFETTAGQNKAHLTSNIMSTK